MVGNNLLIGDLYALNGGGAILALTVENRWVSRL